MTAEKDNLWENDPSLLPYTAARAEATLIGVFQYIEDTNASPSDCLRAEDLAVYEQWKKAKKSDGTEPGNIAGNLPPF